MKIKQIMARVAATCFVVLMWPAAVLAAPTAPVGPTPIANFKAWVLPELQGAFTLGLAGLAVYYFFKRAYAAMIGLLAAAVLVAAMIYSPESVAGMAQKIGDLIFPK